MKTIRIFALLFGLVMASACTDGNFTMNTEIRADGTCSRDIWVKADSATLVDSTREQTGLVRDVINNAAWQKRVWINDSSDDLSYPLSPAQYDSLASLLSAGGKSLADTLSIHASREFSSVGEMAANWPVFIDGERLKAEAKLEKKFRWFYTDYTFCETFECLMPKFGLPLTDFLTQDEVDFWLKGEPNLFEGVPGMEMSGSLEAYEKIVSRWVNANLCNDDALAIAKYYDSIPNPPMSRKAFVAKWDSLVRNLDNFPTTWFDKPQYFVFQNAFNSDFYQKLSEIDWMIFHRNGCIRLRNEFPQEAQFCRIIIALIPEHFEFIAQGVILLLQIILLRYNLLESVRNTLSVIIKIVDHPFIHFPELLHVFRGFIKNAHIDSSFLSRLNRVSRVHGQA